MIESNNSPGAVDTEPFESVSEIMVRARKAAGLSQADVAEQLYLTATFIRYIDEGQFDKFPKPAFVKGYLRSYARVVALSGDEVVAAYDRQHKEPEQDSTIGSVTEEPMGSSSITGPVVQTGILGLVAALIVIALVWWLVSDSEDTPAAISPVPEKVVPSQSLAETPVNRVPIPVPGGEQSLASEPVMPLQDALVEDTTPPESAVPEVRTPLAADSDVQIERVRDGDTNYITVYAGGDRELELSFSDECWVEVEDGTGKKIYGDLNRAGDMMTVHGVAPFVVLLGNATAASMTFEGRAVDLSRFTTRDQTARIRTARL